MITVGHSLAEESHMEELPHEVHSRALARDAKLFPILCQAVVYAYVLCLAVWRDDERLAHGVELHVRLDRSLCPGRQPLG